MRFVPLALVVLAMPAPAQTPARLSVSAKSLTVYGTSNLHDWHCATSNFTVTITASPGTPASLGRAVDAIDVAIPVRSLDCGNGQMNAIMYKTMNADRNPTIQFRMTAYASRPAANGSYDASVTGALTINGVTKPVTLSGHVTPNAQGGARGDLAANIRTTDFEVQAVKALFGAIKTSDRVRIAAAIAASAPPSVVAAAHPVATPAPQVPRATPATTSTVSRPAVASRRAPARPESSASATTPPPRVAPVADPSTARAAIPVLTPAAADSAPARMDSVVRVETSVAAQSPGEVVGTFPDTSGSAESADAGRAGLPANRIQHLRPRDARGLLMFEPPKQDTVSYDGFALQWGAAFTQEFQDVDHENAAVPVMVGTVNQNQLSNIGAGFNNAVANLYLDAQLARGVRVALTSYLSSRHHNETWVKDGYFLIDESPIANALLDRVMRDVTLKVGHFEVNYGDAHFRRTDNGQALYNPLVGNLIMDAFTTEIGAEVYWRRNALLAMAGATGGETRGMVTGPEARSPAWLAKIGFDRDLDGIRVRLTGSTYGSAKARSNALYTGDRAGSPYFMVMENTQATESANAWSGNLRPGFTNVVHAYMINPFVKFGPAEFFGTVETATGKANIEARKRTVRQWAGEGVLRFGPGSTMFAAARYNRAGGELTGFRGDISVDRVEMGGGWFVLPTVLTKLEYVIQRYHDFPALDIRSGGKFSGVMIAGTVAF